MTSATVRPGRDEYFAYYDTYVSKVPDGDIIQQLKAQLQELEAVLGSLPDEVGDRVHAPYTWSIKQVVGHLIDAERIFADRLHKFAMGDQQEQRAWIKMCTSPRPITRKYACELCSMNCFIVVKPTCF